MMPFFLINHQLTALVPLCFCKAACVSPSRWHVWAAAWQTAARRRQSRRAVRWSCRPRTRAAGVCPRSFCLTESRDLQLWYRKFTAFE